MKEIRNPNRTRGVLLIMLGVLLAALGLRSFLLPNRFVDGGITGVSMILSDVLPGHLSLFLIVVNAPFVALGYFQIGKRFAIRAAVAIGALAVCVYFARFPEVTHDKLLAAVFGGFFLGSGIGLSIRGGSVLDGTEILALALSRRLAATLGDIILVLNIAIFSSAAFVFGVESALYSILTYLSASKTVDFILYGIEAYNGIMIISVKNDEIRRAIVSDLARGVTVMRGGGGFTEGERDILYCVVTRLEMPSVRNLVASLDPSAVVFIHHISDASGGVLKPRPLGR